MGSLADDARAAGQGTAARSIVVAEDERLMARLLVAVLETLGRPVHLASDGDAALSLVRESQPALLVLDLHMPKRGGLEVLRTLRLEMPSSSLRILVLTTQGQADSEARVREAGADDFLAKPVDPEAVLVHARRLLAEP